ncbi:hypothetical protein QZH41_000487 [Actinostola sp. cb2023]|nr:hypothetical protein QZH41_000487 [Actinostola sp. cb2023]
MPMAWPDWFDEDQRARSGLPFEKELLRVKRKGDNEEEEGNGGQRLHRREVASLKEILEDDREIRRKRRFQSEEIVEKNDAEKYPNKMAARSSRSSREDNDITARGMERFLIRENKSTVSRDHLPRGENDDSSSGSGLWENSGSNSDDDLPKFFSAVASNSHYMEVGRVGSGSGSGSGMESKQTNLVSDLAEEVHQDRKPIHAEPATEPTKQKRSSDNHIQKRDILHEFFEGSDVIYRSRREKIDTDLEEKLASFFRNLKGDQVASHEPESPHEPPPIPAVTTSKRKSKVIKTIRDVTSSQGNDDSEGLTGLSLVKRFYRDQNMEETGQTKKVYPDSVRILKDMTSIPLQDEEKRSEVPAVHKTTAKKTPESNDIKRSDPFEPRVVHKKELPRAHVTIIEEPAVYSKTEEGMDSSEGGMNVEEDESEPAIEIHERDIREDGYVGCYADRSPDRDLPFPVSVRKLTPTTCRMACKDDGQAYAGLQYGYLCRCGNSYGKYTRLAEEQCSTACKGDKTQICGGFFRSSIYATGTTMLCYMMMVIVVVVAFVMVVLVMWW